MLPSSKPKATVAEVPFWGVLLQWRWVTRASDPPVPSRSKAFALLYLAIRIRPMER